MDTDGIDVKGNRISINGDPVWARDDIIVMNPNATGDDAWRKTVDGIEKYMMEGSVRLDSNGYVVTNGGTVYTRNGGRWCTISRPWHPIRR